MRSCMRLFITRSVTSGGKCSKRRKPFGRAGNPRSAREPVKKSLSGQITARKGLVGPQFRPLLGPDFRGLQRCFLLFDRCSRVRLKQKRAVRRRKEVLLTTVPKLINIYISGTLFAVFRNPTSVLKKSLLTGR